MGKVNTDAAAFAYQLRRWRKETRMTQWKLGELVKPPMLVAAIARYESGRSEPKISVVRRLAEALEIDPAELIKPIPSRKK